MSDPFPSAAFNLERDGLHIRSFMEFRVGDLVWPVASQYLPEALVLENFQIFFSAANASLALISDSEFPSVDTLAPK